VFFKVNKEKEKRVGGRGWDLKKQGGKEKNENTSRIGWKGMR
jgi:hypothetical protein